MKRILFIVAILCAFIFSPPATADLAPADEAPPAIVAATAPAAAPVLATCDASCELGKLRVAYEALRSSKDPGMKHLLIFGLIVVALRLLIQLLEKLLGWDVLGASKKRWIPIVLLALAIPVTVLTSLVDGVPWYVAVLYGLTGPGAVFLNEVLNFGKKKPAAVT